MGDTLRYWDFPEGSDQYIWRREKALHPGRDEEAKRIYQTYWKPLLEKLPEGPTLVTNTYKQDMEGWVFTETAGSAQNSCDVGTTLDDGSETDDAERHLDQKIHVVVDLEKEGFTVVQSLFDDDADDCAYGISMCMSF